MKTRFSSFTALLAFMLFAVLIFYTAAFASTATIASETGPTHYGQFDVYSLVLTVNSGGTNTTSMTKSFAGVVHCVETDPGTTAPSDNYDLTINDARGADIMGATMQNRDTATTEIVAPAVLDVPTYGLHTITSTGNTVLNATVTIYIYVRKTAW